MKNISLHSQLPTYTVLWYRIRGTLMNYAGKPGFPTTDAEEMTIWRNQGAMFLVVISVCAAVYASATDAEEMNNPLMIAISVAQSHTKTMASFV